MRQTAGSTGFIFTTRSKYLCTQFTAHNELQLTGSQKAYAQCRGITTHTFLEPPNEKSSVQSSLPVLAEGSGWVGGGGAELEVKLAKLVTNTTNVPLA